VHTCSPTREAIIIWDIKPARAPAMSMITASVTTANVFSIAETANTSPILKTTYIE
jgi:hypothetical protein